MKNEIKALYVVGCALMGAAQTGIHMFAGEPLMAIWCASVAVICTLYILNSKEEF